MNCKKILTCAIILCNIKSSRKGIIMLEVIASSTVYGKMYSAEAKTYPEASRIAEQFLGYRSIDTITIVNLRKVEKNTICNKN